MICTFHQQGNCTRGTKCKFKHEQLQEEQQKEIEQEEIQDKPKKTNQKTHYPKIIKFIDILKLEGTQEILTYNQTLYHGDFFSTAKLVKTEREKLLLQFFRRFQSSYKLNPKPTELILDYVNKNQSFEMEFKFVPSIPRKLLPLKEEIGEGFFHIHAKINEEYPMKPAKLQIINEQVNLDFRMRFSELLQRLHETQLQPFSIVNTINYLDNHFEKFCEEI